MPFTLISLKTICNELCYPNNRRFIMAYGEIKELIEEKQT